MTLNHNVEPWSTGVGVAFGQATLIRPWYAPESQGRPHTYKDPEVVRPPRYDTTPIQFADGLDVFWVGGDGAIGTVWTNPEVDGGKWQSPFAITPPGAAAPDASLAAVTRVG